MYVSNLDFFFRIFKEYFKTTSKPVPKWLPESFILCPKDITTNLRAAGEESGAVLCHKSSRSDEREDFIEIAKSMSTENKPSVWIAKSSSGSKGR